MIVSLVISLKIIDNELDYNNNYFIFHKDLMFFFMKSDNNLKVEDN